jgi:DNA polymerase III alpha subunit
MQSGELIGIPQSASPAMRQAHMRLGTKDLNDASLVQAGIRPGVGGAVKINELIARRRGKPYSFEHPDFEKILAHTYGIVVFQEQIDQLLSVFAGYSAGSQKRSGTRSTSPRRATTARSSAKSCLRGCARVGIQKRPRCTRSS